MVVCFILMGHKLWFYLVIILAGFKTYLNIDVDIFVFIGIF